jgi:3-isopropylmalate dehydrogenase
MGTTARIAMLPGDGVGPEIMTEAGKVLDAVSSRFGHRLDRTEVLVGGAAIDAFGTPLRNEDLEVCRASDAVLLGAIGGPKWDNPEGKVRPEQGLLKLRKSLGLFANLRPVAVMPPLADTSPIKAEIVKDVDIMVVRELTGGLYFGRPSKQWKERRGRVGVDTLLYREHEIVRVARLAFELARGRKRKLASVDKANVLSTSRLWRSVLSEVAEDYPEVALEHVLVDSMTMHLIRHPTKFDVIVTENMFGDILTDEASVLAGSIGLLPSASIGAPTPGATSRPLGVYEPIHGSAPAMAGQGRANPTGMILSAALMLRLSLDMELEAAAVESAVKSAIEQGVRTPDICPPGLSPVSTAQFGSTVADLISGSN